MVQGIFGIGPESHGPIVMVGQDPALPLREQDIRNEHAGAVLVGGSLAGLDVLKRAIEVRRFLPLPHQLLRPIPRPFAHRQSARHLHRQPRIPRRRRVVIARPRTDLLAISFQNR
jgi:hypothetical protein